MCVRVEQLFQLVVEDKHVFCRGPCAADRVTISGAVIEVLMYDKHTYRKILKSMVSVRFWAEVFTQ